MSAFGQKRTHLVPAATIEQVVRPHRQDGKLGERL